MFPTGLWPPPDGEGQDFENHSAVATEADDKTGGGVALGGAEAIERKFFVISSPFLEEHLFLCSARKPIDGVGHDNSLILLFSLFATKGTLQP